MTDEEPIEAETDPQALAAVDLGSNSFHLVVAREVRDRVQLIDKLRDRVALAEGLGASGRLDAVTQARALACLERYGARLRPVPLERRRAVGTATFRKLRDGGEFQSRAEKALGMPIEVLPGREEARLVYLGVAHSLGGGEGRRLVVDIGGASTECIIGERFTSHCEDSLAMGCVTWTRRYFPGGLVNASAMDRAEVAGQVELEPVADVYRKGQWDHAIGSSGTIRSIERILEAEGWAEGAVTREGLDRLTAHIVEAGRPERLKLGALRPDRRGVLCGGVAVLRAVFASLELDSMQASKGALREGVLYDLTGRIHDEDIREQSVRRFALRFGVDLAHAQRVRETTLALLDQVEAVFDVSPADRQLLGWAAMLHAVGLAVSYSGYHKHGAYLVEHADLAGFSRQDRRQLGLLIRCQRHSLRPELLAGLPGDRMLVMRGLLPALRIALVLHRDRVSSPIRDFKMCYAGSRVRLEFPPGSLAANPLVRAELEVEKSLMAPMGIVLDAR